MGDISELGWLMIACSVIAISIAYGSTHQPENAVADALQQCRYFGTKELQDKCIDKATSMQSIQK